MNTQLSHRGICDYLTILWKCLWIITQKNLWVLEYHIEEFVNTQQTCMAECVSIWLYYMQDFVITLLYVIICEYIVFDFYKE